MIERCSLASAIMFGHVAQQNGGANQQFHVDADVSRWSRHELEARASRHVNIASAAPPRLAASWLRFLDV